ncbi:putative ubiquitination network signaling protein acrB [Cladobotryum mycophilum]|uniref:Ubiquitination network signaling protein acrB n=1 Tax=Cladobotryum mycophilum TaxID=491253 RepID=A0ABR0SWB9_9HYPO
MPRASGSGKRQSGGAGHRDTKQENGIVGSNKRVSGRKSLNNQYDGSARPADYGVGHAGPSLPAHQLAANGGVSSFTSSSSSSKGGHFDSPASLDNRSGDARRPSLGTYSEASSESCASSSHLGTNGVVVVDGSHRQIDVNAMKNADVHRDSGPIEMVATVLKSLPMQDTLAILILLMQLPSLSLSFIYAIFTCLTFVPPVTTSSGINLNFAEIFDGSSTMPSLVTVMCMDFFFLLIWLFLWQPIQDTILDLAKPVIAITLGGGTTSRDGSSRGLTTCFAWVVLNHLIRGTRAHWTRLMRHIPDDWRLPSSLSNSFERAVLTDDRRSTLAWIRSALAIHILTQGLVRYIREWYLRREKANAAAGLNDPEAGKSLSATSGTGDAAQDAGFSTPDPEAGYAPASNASTSKRRRKQGTQVRLQQPLWAALASTKIVVMKEYESSHVPSESQGTNATDIHNLGNAPFNTQPRQIWISYIGSDEFCFNTSPFPDLDDDAPPPTANGHGVSRPAGVDTSKPFYVRVNNAFWQPTRIFPVEDLDDDVVREGTRWTGDIYGLRPASKYVCEFVDSRTDKVVFSTSIHTVKEPMKENKSGSVAVSEPQPSLQPDSPATTLRTSIVAAEAKLADEKNRLKTWRKEWKSRINTLRKENESTDNQLSSAGNSDDKLKQKIRQQETQKAQAERDTDRLAEQLKNFDGSPEVTEGEKKMKKAFAAERKLYEAAQKTFKEHKSRLENEVQAKEVEKSNLNTRRNKIATRIAKVENELATITDANNRGLNEVERRRQERAVWYERVIGAENSYNEQLAHAYAANAARVEHIRNLQAQIHGFQTYVNAANGLPLDLVSEVSHAFLPQQQPSNAWNHNANPGPSHFPSASMGMWPSAPGDLLPPVSIAAGQHGISAWQPPPTAPAFEPRGSKARGRSSSMLSDISGFTQSSREEPKSPMGGRLRPLYTKGFGINGSRGSTGSGGSGSIDDPVSPV